MDLQAPLTGFQPSRAFFVGIDSDGCAFDTMEVKHKECFIPAIIRCWRLQTIARYARETGEFINLYSRDRGLNRWPALVRLFELLRERPEVRAIDPPLPDLVPLKAFCASGKPLSDAGVRMMLEETGHPVFRQALEWSAAVNAAIAARIKGVPPFPFVRESLERLQPQADLMVVSATDGEALRKEWAEHDLARFVRLIAGQEMGTKREHLALAAAGRYAPGRILMIGDAPGDLEAARATGALFYPINPGDEARSWKRFHDEGCERFLNETYAGEYEAGLIEEFEARLPQYPPWQV